MDKEIFEEAIKEADKSTNGLVRINLKDGTLYTGKVITFGEDSFLFEDKYKKRRGINYSEVSRVSAYGRGEVI